MSGPAQSTPSTEKKQDEALQETFPASDPPSTTPPPGSRKAEMMEDAAGDPSPTGLPSSDRHDSETASVPSGDLHQAHTSTHEPPAKP